MSIQINRQAEAVVRAPYQATEAEIRDFIEKNSGWLEKHLAKAEAMKQRREESPYGPITEADIERYAKIAADTIPPRVGQYARQMGVTFNRITIRCQRTVWGSCSSKKNLNFNCLLMLTPPEVQNYVIVHELAHLKEMNHSSRFWAEVEKVLPDYRQRRKWLKTNGQLIIDAVEAWQ